MAVVPFKLNQQVQPKGSDLVGVISLITNDGSYVRFRTAPEKFFKWEELTDATDMEMEVPFSPDQKVRVKADGRVGIVNSLRWDGVNVRFEDDHGYFDWAEVEAVEMDANTRKTYDDPFKVGQHVQIKGTDIVGTVVAYGKEGTGGVYVRFKYSSIDPAQFFEWYELAETTELPTSGSPKSLQRVRINADGRLGTVCSLRAGGVIVQLRDGRGSFDWSEVTVV